MGILHEVLSRFILDYKIKYKGQMDKKNESTGMIKYQHRILVPVNDERTQKQRDPHTHKYLSDKKNQVTQERKKRSS
jgi:hypothetical protein